MRQSHQNYNLYGTFHAIHRRQLTLGIWWTVFPITTWKWGGLMDDWYIHTVSSLSKSVKKKLTENVNSHYRHIFKPKDQVTKSTNQITEIAEQTLMQDKTVLHMIYSVPFILPPPPPPTNTGLFSPCVVSPYHTCKQFRTVLNSPLHSCISNEIIWDFGIRPASNSSADNKGEMDGYKTRAIISLCTVFLFFFKLLVYSLGLSGVLMKCCDVKVFPSGYLGWAGSLESIYVQNKCITSWKKEIARSV